MSETSGTLNLQQSAAAGFGLGPLLIVAGAGTGKTATLAHRVAHLISTGINPGRILLLTFSRRAAAEMNRRVRNLLAQSDAKLAGATTSRLWSGTFHAIAHRILRLHSASVGLGDAFTVIDRADAEDLMDDARAELKLHEKDVRFPKKSTCVAIYSRCVNARVTVEEVLPRHFPWCQEFPEQLKALFRLYTVRKQSDNVLDYDDLLLYWDHLMQLPGGAAEVRGRFDAVLVDEYQDTNYLQANILKQLRPDGMGLTVVGDDAQSIYGFRAATVHNILDFPTTWPGATVLKLEQNYRSVQPILEATNAVIGLCQHRYNKDLFSTRGGRQKPRLVTVLDEEQQSDYVIKRILEHREEGIGLKRQAVLFRASHHSDTLEVELSRRNIPFVKYGGLKFLEAAHVKDVLSILRLAENPKDTTSAFRVLQMLDGIGPASAKRAIAHLAEGKFELKAWGNFIVPAAAAEQWPAFLKLMEGLTKGDVPLPQQVADVKRFYGPILEKRFDEGQVRRRDLDQLEQISGSFGSRGQMLSELTLDPPASTQDLAGPPLRDEDYLILSTIHSAKGCEWDAVYVIHAADGNIPSDMATGTEEEIEEERRLFYVALTRARDFLEIVFPLKYYQKKWGMSDKHSYAQLTRFLPEGILGNFERLRLEPTTTVDAAASAVAGSEIKRKIAAMWG